MVDTGLAVVPFNSMSNIVTAQKQTYYASPHSISVISQLYVSQQVSRPFLVLLAARADFLEDSQGRRGQEMKYFLNTYIQSYPKYHHSSFNEGQE